jgi:hypothetical protein
MAATAQVVLSSFGHILRDANDTDDVVFSVPFDSR